VSGATLGWLLAAMAAFLAASTGLRAYVDNGRLGLLIAALVLYTLGNLLMVRLMRDSGMAIAVSVSAVLQLVLVNAVAILGFGERPAATQLAGIVLGVVAVGLIVLPPGSRP